MATAAGIIVPPAKEKQGVCIRLLVLTSLFEKKNTSKAIS